MSEQKLHIVSISKDIVMAIVCNLSIYENYISIANFFFPFLYVKRGA